MTRGTLRKVRGHMRDGPRNVAAGLKVRLSGDAARRAERPKRAGCWQSCKRVRGESTLILTRYVALDEKDEALRQLKKAYEVRSSWLPWLKVEPKFDALQSDPRFINLLTCTGLSQ